MNNEILEAALTYAKRGWAVFPVSRDKKPLTLHGVKDASKEESIIREWWSKNPNANVAVATGSASGGLVVIDLDVDEEKDKHGDEAFELYCEEHGLYIDSLTAITGRGGKHIYFSTSAPYGCKVGALQDVDIRGEGGYVVAPPSIHQNGNEYFWDSLNDETDEIICVQDDSDVEYFFNCIFMNNKPGEKFEMPEEVSEGNRNATIFKMASSLQARGEDDDTIFAICQGFNEKKVHPPLSDSELQKTIQSALRYEKGNVAKTETTETVQEDGKTTYKREVSGKGNRKIVEEFSDDDLIIPTVAEAVKKTKKWLVTGYIPEGCVTLLCSDGGIGKTTIWCDTLAALTTGRTTLFDKASGLPFETGTIHDVMYFSKEDPTGEVLKDRLEKAGADQRRIRFVELDDEKINKVWYGSLFLEKLIDKYRPSIVVFDTLQTFLPDGVDMAKRKDMRDALSPLNQLGAKYGTSFLMIMHTNKSSSSGRQRMADSSDIWDLGRSALMCGRTKDKSVCYMSHEKSNYGRLQPTILFSITDDGVEYKGTTKKKDADFMTERQMISSPSPKKDEAKQFILDQLKEADKNTIEIKELDAIGIAAGISKSTLEDARAELVNSKEIVRKGYGFGKDKKWIISLPLRKNPE